MRLLFLLLCLAPSMSPALADPTTRQLQSIDAVLSALPDYEKAAQDSLAALKEYDRSDDPLVHCAADNTRLRAEVLLSLRDLAASDPAAFAFTIDHLKAWKAGLDYFLACAKNAQDPFAGRSSGVRAVRSAIDGQLLFYQFRLPRDYDPAQRYPLHVELRPALRWRAAGVDGPPANTARLANTEPVIWISPCGRGDNAATGMGISAVLEAIADVRAAYAVDPQRISLGGVGLGGAAALRLGSLYPDLFDAIHSLPGVVPLPLRFDAALLAGNFANTPVVVYDTVGDEQDLGHQLDALAQQYPGMYLHQEITDDGQPGSLTPDKLDAGRQWLAQHPRQPEPRRIIFRTPSLRHDRAAWLTLDGLERSDAPAGIVAEILDGPSLRLTTDNLVRFHVALPPVLIGAARQLPVWIDGQELGPLAVAAEMFFTRDAGRWQPGQSRYPAQLVKKHALSGPVADVFMGEPVLMVYGTLQQTDAARSNAMVDAAVQSLFGPEDGGTVFHTRFDRKADLAVSPQDIADRHLVLFGTPEQNSLLRQLADKLPVQFFPDGVQIAGRRLQGQLVMVYPNPLNPEKYLLILPENYSAGSPAVFPDYLVLREQQAVAKGFFDGNWKPEK